MLNSLLKKQNHLSVGSLFFVLRIRFYLVDLCFLTNFAEKIQL